MSEHSTTPTISRQQVANGVLAIKNFCDSPVCTFLICKQRVGDETDNGLLVLHNCFHTYPAHFLMTIFLPQNALAHPTFGSGPPAAGVPTNESVGAGQRGHDATETGAAAAALVHTSGAAGLAAVDANPGEHLGAAAAGVNQVMGEEAGAGVNAAPTAVPEGSAGPAEYTGAVPENGQPAAVNTGGGASRDPHAAARVPRSGAVHGPADEQMVGQPEGVS